MDNFSEVYSWDTAAAAPTTHYMSRSYVRNCHGCSPAVITRKIVRNKVCSAGNIGMFGILT